MNWFVKTLPQEGIEVPRTFVETGTYRGEGVQSALNSGHFEKIYSIDINTEFQVANRLRFTAAPTVEILDGNSVDVLTSLIDSATLPQQPVLFFLDAHFAGADTGGADVERGCPLLKELAVIARRGVVGDIVVIDDMRHIGQARWGGQLGNAMYPPVYLDFTHVTVDAIGAALASRVIGKAKMYPDMDRLVLVLT
jgi:hypothetical protein